MATSDNQYVLVLLGRYPGKDRPVAHALAQTFGRDEAWGLQVVGAAPVIVLDGMTAEQAQLVHESMADVEGAGSRFEIQYGAVEGMSKLHWPSPPRLRGRSVTDFSATAGKTTFSLVVPCPYTGQKMKLTITVQTTRMTAENVLPMVSASPAAAPGAVNQPIPLPPPAVPVPSPMGVRPPSRANVLPSAHVSVSTPVAMPAVRPAGPPIPVPVAAVPSYPPRPQPPRQPMPPTEIPAAMSGLESLEELIPMEQFPPAPPKPPARSPQHGTPMAARPPSSGAPLPDVPILHSAAPPKPVGLPEVPAAPMPPMVSAPMDLEVFEQRVSSSGTFRAPVLPEADEQAPAADDDGSLCSVFMGKSNNVRVHQVLAELHGIPVPEAGKLCQKALVAVAKDVTTEQAMEIKQRFAAVNVNVRIAKRKQ